MTPLATRLRWQKIVASGRPAALKVTLLSSFTVSPLCPYLGVALEGAGLAAEIRVGPYDQVSQQCLDPESEMSRFRPTVVVIWPRLEDLWSGMPWPLDDAVAGYAQPLHDLVDVALGARTRLAATVVFVLPAIAEMRPLGVGDAGNPEGVFAAATAAREAARARLAGSSGVLVADAEETLRWIGSARGADRRRAVTSRIPYSEEVFMHVGERVGRLIRLDRNGARKVVVVDGDNTLWGGVVGEEGAAGIDLLDNGPGEAFREFQRYLLELRRSGCLLALASKNNEPDLWEAFDRREMVIRRSHLAAWRVNWSPKSVAIQEMAEELNLGTASFVLVDDSEIERAEVNGVLPEVVTVAMPEAAEMWFDTVAGSGELDRLPPTAADRTRARAYESEGERRTARQAISHDEFLASLGLVVDIDRPTPGDLARFAQLVAKTNQFTLGGRRRSEVELADCVVNPRFAPRIASARDRFGDYGMIGAFLVDRQPEGAGIPDQASWLDTFVLSCRAMGRGIELAMISSAHDLAGRELWTEVHIDPKNAPCQEFFARFGVAPGSRGRLPPVAWPDHIGVSDPLPVPAVAAQMGNPGRV